ncbi:hypothetical protein, partial [Mycolicibacterium fluoranthenivorans]
VLSYLDPTESVQPMPPQRHPGGISAYVGRSTRRYRKLRAAFRHECATEDQPGGTTGRPCWLCGKPIDYSLPDDHPDGFNLDHAYTVADRPDLAEDPANFRPAHKACNGLRGNNDPFIQIGSPSEDW